MSDEMCSCGQPSTTTHACGMQPAPSVTAGTATQVEFYPPGYVEQLRAQLATITADRDRLARDLKTMTCMWEGLRDTAFERNERARALQATADRYRGALEAVGKPVPAYPGETYPRPCPSCRRVADFCDRRGGDKLTGPPCPGTIARRALTDASPPAQPDTCPVCASGRRDCRTCGGYCDGPCEEHEEQATVEEPAAQPAAECAWCRKSLTVVEAKHLTVCSPCWDANCRGREAFASGTALRDEVLAKMAAAQPVALREAREVARLFHDAYERLAPGYGWTTNAATAVEWDKLPTANRELMVHVVNVVLDEIGYYRIRSLLSSPGGVGR